MSKNSRLIATTLILLVGIIGTKLINFIMLPFLTAWLTPEEYGNVDIFLTIIAMAVPIVTLQLEQAAFRFLIDDKSLAEKRETASSCLLSVCAVLLPGGVAACGVLLLLDMEGYVLYVAAIVLNALYVLAQQLVRGEGKNRAYTVSSILFAFLVMGLAAVFIRVGGMGTRGYILGYLIATSVCILQLTLSARLDKLIRFAAVRREKLRRMMAYSAPMILNNVSWWILNASDKLVINIFIGSAANGIFAAAGKIPGLITSVYSVFQMAWQESASREQNKDGLEDFYSGVFRALLALISLGVAAILLTLAILFPILVDDRYREAYNHIPILLLGLFFLCMAQFYGGIYVGLHKSSELGWTSAVAAVVNLAVDLVLVRFVGLYAASFSTLSAYCVLFGIRAWKTRQVVRIRYRAGEILLAALIMGAALAGSLLLPVPAQLGLLALIMAVYAVAYRDLLKSMAGMVLKKLKHR